MSQDNYGKGVARDSSMGEPRLVIWDFDGVICDSLLECATVTMVAVHSIEQPQDKVTKENLYRICSASMITRLYERMRRLRPFVLKGQDYLWQYFNPQLFNEQFTDFPAYQERFNGVFSVDLDRVYERAFYEARIQLADLMGGQYFSLFKPHPGALCALRASLRRYRNYVCTARDQHGVTLLFTNNAIEFPREKIFSKDFNGATCNDGMGKTDQILAILEREGGRDQDFLIIEDQVKAPAELKANCSNMHVIYASYGYGLKQDWDSADIPNLQEVTDPALLIYRLY